MKRKLLIGLTSVLALQAIGLAVASQVAAQVDLFPDTNYGNRGADLTAVIQYAVRILLYGLGATSVIMMIIAGFQYVTANGDANNITKAKSMIQYGIVGIIVAASCYSIVHFVLGWLK